MHIISLAPHVSCAPYELNRSHFFWHFTNKFFLMRESRHALMLGWICYDILDLSLAVALKRNGHFNWCANVRLHTCIIIIIVSWHFSIYSIAFIACNYDPLNTFAKLIVKTLKCHFELHIKVNQTHFLFRLKGFFLCILAESKWLDRKTPFKYVIKTSGKWWKFWNLYSTSNEFAIFIWVFNRFFFS